MHLYLADPACTGSFGKRPIGVLAHIRDESDVDAGRLQVDCRPVGLVVSCDHDRGCAWQNAVTVDVGAGGAGQHDARPVIARKHERALDRAGGENDFLRPDLPGPLAWQMLGQRLR